jgi:hypothetical protein
MGSRGIVHVLRALDELPSVRGAWQALQWHPAGDVDGFAALEASRPGFRRPHVLRVERDGATVGLVAGVVGDEEIPWRVGSLRVLRSRARVLRVAAPAVMGECDAGVAGAVVAALCACLEAGEVDALYLHQLERGSPLLAAAQGAPGRAFRDRFSRAATSWRLDLPASFDEFYRSRSKAVRKAIRRYGNLLERELPGVRAACLREPGDLERIVRDSLAVAGRTYHQGLGVAFTDDPRTRAQLGHALAHVRRDAAAGGARADAPHDPDHEHRDQRQADQAREELDDHLGGLHRLGAVGGEEAAAEPTQEAIEHVRLVVASMTRRDPVERGDDVLARVGRGLRGHADAPRASSSSKRRSRS